MDTVLIVIGVISALTVLICTVLNVVFSSLLVTDKRNENDKFALLEKQLTNIETYLKQLSEEIETSLGDDIPPGMKFHSLDGRFHGNSWQDILRQQMLADGVDITKMTPGDFKKFLDDINSETSLDEEEDDDEGDDESEKWKTK